MKNALNKKLLIVFFLILLSIIIYLLFSPYKIYRNLPKISVSEVESISIDFFDLKDDLDFVVDKKEIASYFINIQKDKE